MFAANEVAKAIESLIREMIRREAGKIAALPDVHALVMALERLIEEARRK
jgi:hypothetical protein